MKQTIRNRWTNEILYEAEADDLRAAVKQAVRQGKNLAHANLAHANLDGANLAGEQVRGLPLCIGPIGSRNAYVTFMQTDKSIQVRTGCFAGTIQQFVVAVEKTHSCNQHSKDYLAACELARQVLTARMGVQP